MAANGDLPQVFSGSLHIQTSPEYAAIIDSRLSVLDPTA